MLFIATGDWHITNNTPRARKDNYPEVLFGKIKFILDYADENDIPFVVQPGDFFDSPRVSHALVSRIAELLVLHDARIICCNGQHDLQFHNSENPNTPLNVLKSAGLVQMENQIEGIDIRFDYAGWEKEIEGPSSLYPYNILLTHRMVINNEKLWTDQEDYEEGPALLRNHKYDFIISGDNHSSFTCELDKRFLINCGSLMRSTTAQRDHVPHFFVCDTEKRTIKQVDIPCLPIDEVMDFEAHDTEVDSEVKERLETFVSGLQTQHGLVLDFKSNVIKGKSEVSIGAQSIIDEIFE